MCNPRASRWRCALLVALLAGIDCKKSAPGQEHRYHKIDVHTHVTPAGVERLVALMNAHGIDMAVNLSGQGPGRGLEEQLRASEKFGGRVIVFANLDWRMARLGPGYGDRMAADLERACRMGARGLKIFKGLGLGFRDYRSRLIAVDDPELDPVFEKAGELGVPVAIHTGDPVAFWSPPTAQNERHEELVAHPEWSLYGRAVPTWEELFRGLERRIARHPDTLFVSVHFGNAAEYPARVRELLEKYPNLYIDTAARIPELGRHSTLEMRRIFLDHRDRILFATDLGVGDRTQDLVLGSSGPSPPEPAEVEHFFAATWRFFETSDRDFAHPTSIQGSWAIDGLGLPPDVLRLIYGQNAARLLRLDARP